MVNMIPAQQTHWVGLLKNQDEIKKKSCGINLSLMSSLKTLQGFRVILQLPISSVISWDFGEGIDPAGS